MSVRFVVGRAGSGKTWRCLEAIRTRLRADPVRGPRLLFIVPEQATFQMERALIETPDLPGFVRCEVLSFQRLAFRIFAETGADPRQGDQTIGTLGRLMALRRLIRRQRGGLQLLDRVADKPGLIQQLAATLTELMREDVTPETLAELAERIGDEDPLSSARLGDVTRLYQAYLDYLVGDRIDPAQYQALAAERLGDCAAFRAAEVWIDGFAGFTRQQYRLLTELAGVASFVEVSVLADPRASAVTATDYPALSYSLFARTERTLVRLRNTLTAASLGSIEIERLSDEAPARFVSPALGQLERCLFRKPPDPADSAAPSPAVELVEVPDRRSEVQAAIAEIRRLTRETEPPMRYRDIAIIVRDLSAYHDLIVSAMRSHSIPCFLDRRQPTTHHPLVELVRGMLGVAADNARPNDVRLTLKTQLLPIDTEASDLLENYILAGGIDGLRAWREPWTHTRLFSTRHDSTGLSTEQQAMLDRVNAARTAWHGAMAPWLACLEDDAEQTGRCWATRLYDALRALEIARKLSDWAQQAEDDGRTAEANAHRQVWTDFVEMLDEFVQALGDETMTLPEFRETVEAGLAEFSLGLAPATLDEVLVGSVERSRHPSMRAVLLLGFDEQHFPFKRGEDPMLGDNERDALQSMGREIGPSRKVNLLDERMLAYIAMTRAGERLWISYPRCDADGKPLLPSPFLQDVRRALPGLEINRLDDPYLDRGTRWLTDVRELGARLAHEMRNRTALSEEPNTDARRVWNGIYDAVRENTEWKGTIRRCLSGLAYRNDAGLEDGIIELAVRKPFVASVSRLEKFAACPFAHYARYLLNLEQRVEAELDQMDLGTVCHAILEKFFGRLVEGKQSLGELEADEITTGIDAAATEVLTESGDEYICDQARNAYLLDRSRDHVKRVTYWQHLCARSGRFRPLAVEYPFGTTGLHNAIKLTTPAGRTIYLRGYIDRVDVAELGDTLVGAVVDYKRTTSRRLSYADVYHGLSLQLIGYLLALQQHGESLAGRPIVPVGAFYLPLLEGYKTVAHPDEEREPGYKCRGVADASVTDVLDECIATDRKSAYFSANMTKSGEPYANSDLVSGTDLRNLMRHVGRRMGELADQLLEGRVEVAPYRLNRKTPCGFCEYRAVCRYEPETQPPRHLDGMKKKDVVEKLIRGADDDN